MFQASSSSIDGKPEPCRAELACLSFVVHPALALLWQARDLAAEAFGSSDVESAWAFAPQVTDLVTLGMSEPQLRLLVVKGFVACRGEARHNSASPTDKDLAANAILSPAAGENAFFGLPTLSNGEACGEHRQTGPGVRVKHLEQTPIARVGNGPTTLTRSSLVMLTHSGASALTAMLEPWHNGHANHLQQTFSKLPVDEVANSTPHVVASYPSSTHANGIPAPHLPGVPTSIRPNVDSHAKPHYDKDRRELWFQGHLIKRYKTPAKNQELILLAFEEEGWPVRIDDPLSPLEGIDRKLRLRDTITALNHHQKHLIIGFHGDGVALGVIWKVISDGDGSPTSDFQQVFSCKAGGFDDDRKLC